MSHQQRTKSVFIDSKQNLITPKNDNNTVSGPGVAQQANNELPEIQMPGSQVGGRHRPSIMSNNNSQSNYNYTTFKAQEAHHIQLVPMEAGETTNDLN